MLEDEVQVVIAADDDELYRVRRDVAKELRRTRKLPIAVLDQDEGDEEPLPVAERLDLARRADLVLVLLGSGYGEPPPGTQRSLPHLQYDVALASPHMALVCSEIASAAAPSSALIDWEERSERRVRIDRRHAIDPQLADGVAHLVRDAAHTCCVIGQVGNADIAGQPLRHARRGRVVAAHRMHFTVPSFFLANTACLRRKASR